jgi:hypothetical protein
MKALIDCEICNKSFEASFRGQRPLTCSKTCWIIRNNAYNKAYRKSDVVKTLSTVTAGCRNRAKRRGYDCDIDWEFMKELYDKQSGRCAVTGVILTSSAANTKTYSDPHTISVDRIDNNKGYTKTNVRLVTYMYNTCKGQWNDELVKKMCEAVCGL